MSEGARSAENAETRKSKDSASLIDARPEVARLKAIIDGAVESLCELAEEIQVTDQEMADRLWDLASERLEIPVRFGPTVGE